MGTKQSKDGGGGGGEDTEQKNGTAGDDLDDGSLTLAAAISQRQGQQKVGFWAGIKQGCVQHCSASVRPRLRCFLTEYVLDAASRCSYAELCNAIIRPPRAEYTTQELGSLSLPGGCVVQFSPLVGIALTCLVLVHATLFAGPSAFTFRGRKFVRTDFTVRNKRDQRLVCSHWHPAPYVGARD